MARWLVADERVSHDCTDARPKCTVHRFLAPRGDGVNVAVAWRTYVEGKPRVGVVADQSQAPWHNLYGSVSRRFHRTSATGRTVARTTARDRRRCNVQVLVAVIADFASSMAGLGGAADRPLSGRRTCR
jgi:hypothetical protein